MITDYKIIFSEAADAMMIADGETGKIVDVNKTCCNLLKFSKEALIGRRVTELFKDDENDSVIDDRSFMYGPVINGRKIKCNNGQLKTTDITINTINNGDRTLILTTLRDATDRIAVENELKQLNATKDKFFSIIAHDLKNPLLALTGYSEILDEELESLDKSDVKQYVSSIKKLSKNLSDLIENLLSWARVQTEKIEFEPENIKIRPIVENIIALFQPSIEQKELFVKNFIDNDLVLRCDWNMINTILRNFISNAIKFTPAKGEIVLSNSEDEKENIISIKDSGIGMTQQEINKLFKVDKHFTKQGTNKERGTGLGLLLCYEFIKKHQGDITLTSEEGKGSQFNIKIPMR